MIECPPFTLPFSSLASESAEADFLSKTAAVATFPFAAEVNEQRRWLERAVAEPALNAHRARYAVTSSELQFGALQGELFTPAAGVAPEDSGKILVCLHGGGFRIGGPIQARAEAIPIAAVARLPVLALHYRQSPEHHFPAASDDVAQCYAGLLRDHEPRNIGLFGCSAGGILTAQVTARLLQDGVPLPGAIAMLAGTGELMKGDSVFTSAACSGFAPALDAELTSEQSIEYLSTARPDDPLAYPMRFSSVLEQFPPALLISGSRSVDLSAIITAHNRLTLAGVVSQLHVWDGMHHAFHVDSSTAEAREVYEIVARFFARHLGG